jgi:FixJ family two-component response regulator
MQDANDILIEALMDDVLDPSMVADAVASAIEMLRSEDGGTARATAIDDELERLSQERSRLVSAVTNGQLQGGIFDVLRALETRTARLERERQTL